MKHISTSPHFHSGASTQRIMIDVCIALLPASIWGVCSFGARAALILIISILSSCLTEFLLGRIVHEYTLWDFSAVVTGLIVGLNMPVTIPLFIPVLASMFAIAVAKWTFGGLGANWANPAVSGRVFVFFSFTSAMSSFVMPKCLLRDGVTSASPLSLVKTLVSSGEGLGHTSLELLSMQSYPTSALAQKIQASTGINAYNIDAFLGNIPGCIGEVSVLMLLIGAIYLIVRKVITWHIPVSYILSFGLFTCVFGGIPFGLGLFHGEPLAGVLRGGLMLGACFMATDMVTSPVSHKGMIVFGIGCGFFTFLFRSFGSLPEATSVAILIMNIITPTIDKFIVPKKFGEEVKK